MEVQMQKWEYGRLVVYVGIDKEIDFTYQWSSTPEDDIIDNAEYLEMALSSIGDRGWELVSITQQPPKVDKTGKYLEEVWVFKRPKP
jgi:hypothetical protein